MTESAALPGIMAEGVATTEKPKSTKGRAAAAAKKEATKDAAPVAKEKKEKAVEEKKTEDNEEEESVEGEKKTAAKKRKGGGHSGSRDHPSFEEIIRECIRESKEDRREGVSRPTIKSTCSFSCSTFRFWPPFALPFPAARWTGEWGQHRFGTSGALTRLLVQSLWRVAMASR